MINFNGASSSKDINVFYNSNGNKNSLLVNQLNNYIELIDYELSNNPETENLLTLGILMAKEAHHLEQNNKISSEQCQKVIEYYNKIKSAIANNFRGDYKGYLDRLSQCKYEWEQVNQWEAVLLNSVNEIIQENIFNKKDCKGAVFQITNPKGIKSYLIGTIHIANINMIKSQKKVFNQILDKCDQLFTEIGDESFLLPSFEEQLEVMHKKKWILPLRERVCLYDRYLFDRIGT